MTKHRFGVSIGVVAALGCALPAPAQVFDPDSTNVVPIQPVLVNVLRTPFSLTAAPFAIAVNTENEIQRARPGLGLEEVLGGIPGVQIDDRYNYALGDRLSIRGFGARTQFGIRGVKILVDGVPATLPDGQTNLNHVDFGYLRRAEVIRGPASSLYGNAAGGVVQLETEVPPDVPVSQEVGIVAGSNGLVRLHSTTGGRSGGAAYNLNLARLTFDGYREFQDAEQTQVNGSLGLRALGGDLRFVGSYVDYDANNPGALDVPRLEADRSQACCRSATGAVMNNLLFQTGESGSQGQGGAFWNRRVGSGSIEVAGYAITRDVDNPIPQRIIVLERSAGGLRTLYRSDAVSSLLGLQWSVGLEGDLQRDDRKNFVNQQGARAGLVLDQDETVLGTSAFTQISLSPVERLLLLGGLRLDATRFEADDHLVETGNPDDSGERTMQAISPSIGLSYEVAPAFSLYGNVATSFETPTTSELANQESGAGGFNPALDPQRTLSFEAGAKGLLTNVASYQLSVFRAKVTDALIPFEVPGFAGRSFFRNAGSVIHQGIETGLTVAPIQGLRANVAYTYLDARFDEYTLGGVSLEENRFPGVSPHRLDGSLSYNSSFGLYGNIEARYSDMIWVNDTNTVTSPSYAVVDFRAGLDQLRVGGLVIEPFAGVTNLFDEKYNTSVTVNAFGNRFFEPGPGRSFYGGGQVRFDFRR